MSTNVLWYVSSHSLNEDTCRKILDSSTDSFESGGIIDDTERFSIASKLDENIRVSDIKHLHGYKWILDIITPLAEEANTEAGWHYDIIGLAGLQLTRYKEGGFYDWHKDGFGDHNDAITYGDDPNKYVRKLSMTLLLNDDYEGGEFEINSCNKAKCTISKPELSQGSIVFFPSFMEHRVKPVTKGTRYSLVGWFLGLPLR